MATSAPRLAHGAATAATADRQLAFHSGRSERQRAPRDLPAGASPQKNSRPIGRLLSSVGENLFFRTVSSQVSSAPASLTSVFGMGTGGPSRQSTPTIQFAASLDSFNIIPQPFENCKPFFKIFRKNFAAKSAGLEKRLSQIVLNRASATRDFLKPAGSLAPLTHHTQPTTADTGLEFHSE